MAIIAIEKTDLIGADQLAAFLERRMAEVTWFDPQCKLAKATLPANTFDAYVCSQTYSDAKGGDAAVVELARSLKASRVLIIGRDESEKFSVKTKMKGNLIHLNMAASDCLDPHLSPDFPSNYSLQMAC